MKVVEREKRTGVCLIWETCQCYFHVSRKTQVTKITPCHKSEDLHWTKPKYDISFKSEDKCKGNFCPLQTKVLCFYNYVINPINIKSMGGELHCASFF
jgi:hypothetical protein